jgi:hypothetical protein
MAWPGHDTVGTAVPPTYYFSAYAGWSGLRGMTTVLKSLFRWRCKRYRPLAGMRCRGCLAAAPFVRPLAAIAIAARLDSNTDFHGLRAQINTEKEVTRHEAPMIISLYAAPHAPLATRPGRSAAAAALRVICALNP